MFVPVYILFCIYTLFIVFYDLLTKLHVCAVFILLRSGEQLSMICLNNPPLQEILSWPFYF